MILAGLFEGDIGGMRIWDISPPISARTAVYPDDQRFERTVTQSFERGATYELSWFKTSAHIGAHIDSSSHYHRKGQGVDQRSLDTCMGLAQVITVRTPQGERIRVEHLEGREITAPRVLFHTGSFPDPEKWNSDFCSLSPELVDFLASRGVRFVGIDTPSVDPEDSKDLEAHQAIYRHGIVNLEGIVLDGVPDGEYILVALPLRIEGGDGSPVRAVLLPPDWRGR